MSCESLIKYAAVFLGFVGDFAAFNAIVKAKDKELDAKIFKKTRSLFLQQYIIGESEESRSQYTSELSNLKLLKKFCVVEK